VLGLAYAERGLQVRASQPPSWLAVGMSGWVQPSVNVM
jgi:hypothetical protein